MRHVFSFSIIVFTICAAFVNAIHAQSSEPKLVVVIVVDQMRYDFFDRFGDKFEGGLKRIWDRGVVYSNAHHSHAPTNTGPGHATISTGKYPVKHGIIDNSLYDRQRHEEMSPVGDAAVKIIGVENDGALPGLSPARLKVAGLGDWLKKKNAKSKVYAVARKDRASILLGGKAADRAFWIDDLSTRFVSSTYYGKTYPDWAHTYVGKDMMRAEIEAGWHKKLPEEAYANLRPDDFQQEKGLFYADFPHDKSRMRRGLSDANKDLLMLTATPIGEKYVLDFARALVINEKLGSRDVTDMLLISCSMADAIGHHFGPESHEVMDYYLYLDLYLDEFLTFLDKQIGENQYWVVLSSDHGAQTMPEAVTLRGGEARRVLTSDFVHDIDSIEDRLLEEFGLENILIEHITSGLYLNYIETDAKGFSRKRICRAIAEELISLDYIADAFTSDELFSKTDRAFMTSFKKSYMRDLSPDVIFLLKKNTLLHGPTGSGHGSPYSYDTHVPVIFNVPGFKHAIIERKVSSVDLAPTLAALLGLKADKKVDGNVLTEMLSTQVD
ncbi:MAG: hypothetical protein DRI69_07290 [Bacteroidetes bacterium]|nr:MAG: hypothetical protein DRI69_07290 [Bacteroidota bacterium]